MAWLEEAVPRIEARLDRMNNRPDRMDTRLDGIDVSLRGVEQAVVRLEAKMDVLAGQIIAELPSWWQMPAVIGATVTLLIGLWALVQYMHARGLL